MKVCSRRNSTLQVCLEKLGQSEEQSESQTGQGRSEGGEEWPEVRQGPAEPGKGTVPVEV